MEASDVFVKVSFKNKYSPVNALKVYKGNNDEISENKENNVKFVKVILFLNKNDIIISIAQRAQILHTC